MLRVGLGAAEPAVGGSADAVICAPGCLASERQTGQSARVAALHFNNSFGVAFASTLGWQTPPLSAGDGSDLCVGSRYDKGAQLCTSDASHGVLTTLLVVLLVAGVAFCGWYLFVPHGIKRKHRRRRKY